MLHILACLLAFGQPKATHDDYMSVIAIYDRYSPKINDMAFWEKVDVQDKEKKNFKLKQMTPEEMDMFILIFAKRLTKEGYDLQQSWEKELKRFDQDSYKSDDKNVASKEEVVQYCLRLRQSRAKLAIELERFVYESSKRLKGRVSETELNDMVKGVKKYHDSIKIIERK
jgi:hypothetical protein